MEQMGEMFQRLGMRSTLGSPHTPLLGFETTGGTVDDPEYSKACEVIGGHHLSGETMWLDPIGAAGEWKYAAPSIALATRKALEAYGRKPKEAASRAREALAIDARCPEAFNVLATHGAKSLEEALALYSEGIRQGPFVLVPEAYERASTEGEAFMIPPMRGMFRCINGAAIVLLKLGRYEESYNMFQKLRKLDDNGYRHSSYTNFRYHLPILLLRYKGLAAAERYMHDPAVLENYTLVSTQVPWTYTQALMDFKRAGRPYFPWHYFTMIRNRGEERPGDTSAMEKVIRSQAALCMGTGHMPLVLDFLLGDRELPKGHLPITCVGGGGLAPAVAYVHAVGDQWASTPGALEWARQCRNVWQIVMMLREVEGYGPYNFEKIKEFFATGGWKLPGLRPQDEVERDLILLDATMCKNAKGDVIELLVREGGCNVDVVDHMQLRPINKALYYDRDPSIVQALIRCGARVGHPSREDFSPLAMAINQGNHLALRAALDVLPSIACNARDLRSLYLDLFRTHCYMCIKGYLPEKCQRCRFQQVLPHSPNISFEKCVDVLAEHGLRLDASLEREAAQAVNHPMQNVFVDRLRMQGKLIARRNMLAGEGKGGALGGEANPGVSDGATGPRKSVPSGPQEQNGTKKKKNRGLQECRSCGKSDMKILRCSRCNAVGYCSAECQKVDWSRHKLECKTLAAKSKGENLSEPG